MNDILTTSEHSHRRYNPLTQEWVLVSPHRAKRPWQGQEEKRQDEYIGPSYDEKCYLCPGNKRIKGAVNDQYTKPYVFANDHPALENNVPTNAPSKDALFQSQSVSGEARVICYSPDHAKTLPEMTLNEIEWVIETWMQQVKELSSMYSWVQCFENKGEVMGCSNPHPHGQIWACNFIPNEAQKENDSQHKYYYKNDKVMLVEYLEKELQLKDRVVLEEEYWVVVVPYWAVWPYETLLLPKRKVSHLSFLSEEEKKSLSIVLKKLTTKYDNLFNTSFPYSMGWHGVPFTNKKHDHWQLHAHFYPPLLRSATIKKFMVGFEMLAESQRDLTPEQAASQLRSLSTVHYRKQGQ